jgi:hypothetical protein
MSTLERRPHDRAWGLAWEDRHGHAYDEETFRYFLALERARGRRWGRPVVLLLVELRPRPASGPIGPACTARLFSALAGCLRETDIVGWYHRHRVAGAVLTEFGHAQPADVVHLVVARVAHALDTRLPVNVAHQVALRLYQRPRLTATAEPMLGEDRC